MESAAVRVADWHDGGLNLRFARIIDLLGQPGTLPVLLHCAGGRDRTGVTVALIQVALVASEHGPPCHLQLRPSGPG